MTTNPPRHGGTTLKPQTKGPNGRPTCRYCGAECPPRRTSWCSRECSAAGAIRLSAGTARAYVYHRDGGVCAACGLDSEAWERAYRREESAAWRGYVYAWSGRVEPAANLEARARVRAVGTRWLELLDVMFELGRCARHGGGVAMGGLTIPGHHWWEMDHATPVVEGGGEADLADLRTLCIRCHRGVTAELRARLRASTGVTPG